MTLQVVEEKDGCTFRVHVVPGSRRNEIVGLHGDALKLRLAAPPEKGKANQALTKFLGGWLGIPSSEVEILSGHASRQKRVRVRGVSTGSIRGLLDAMHF